MLNCRNSLLWAWPIPNTDISKTWCVILKVLQYRVANNRMFAQAYWRATKKVEIIYTRQPFFTLQLHHVAKKKSFDAICARMTLLYILSRTWILFSLYHSKEYIERRHGEPFKLLFLPKMGLLGSQASTRKKSNYELWASFELVFSTFHGQKKS